jgi:electron transfer flavoprotein alpha subunit
MSADLVVFAEQEQGIPHRVALELCTGARGLAAELGGQAVAIAFGPGARDAAAALGAHGAARVLVAPDPLFAEYGPAAQADGLIQLLRDGMLSGAARPTAVLLPSTSDGRDIAGRLSARLGLGVLANAIQLSVEAGRLVSQQSAFEGALLISCETRGADPAVITVRPKTFAAQARDGAAAWDAASLVVEELAIAPRPESCRARAVQVVQETVQAGVSLDAAPIVVSGGRGMGGPEAFALVRELAGLLGGAVGASRAAVDAGWVPYTMQVGQTGTTVRPALYVACGISGALQHRVGMQGSEAIVAINRDPDAPIFALADLGIVGDVHDILPRLIEEIRRRKAP